MGSPLRRIFQNALEVAPSPQVGLCLTAVGFKELLDQKLGPMRDLITRPARHTAAPTDPHSLWYRRAAGLEVRVRPEASLNEVEVGLANHPDDLRSLLWSRLAPLLALTQWQSAEQLRGQGLSSNTLWTAVEQDLLYYARQDPGVRLSGQAGILADAQGEPIRRRLSMWPTGAIATATEIAPMPFMPRGRDLADAELVGMRFASLERGYEVFGATITGGRKTGNRLRDLLPLLNGQRNLAQILECFDAGRTRDYARELLAVLDGLTLLERAPGTSVVQSKMAAPTEPQVTWLGHAGALIQAEGVNILVDPLFNSVSEPEDRWVWPPKFDPRVLPEIHAIFITHADNDHLNPNSLLQLPRTIPIYIPHSPSYPLPHQVDIRGQLAVLGFKDVRELRVADQADLGGMRVTAYPFVGENWDLEVAQLTYLVEAEGLSCFLSTDSESMNDVYDALGAKAERIDLALLGVSGAAEPLVGPSDLGYGNFYAEWVPRARHNEWVQHCAGPEQSALNAARFSPRFAFGYACGGASYLPMAYCDRGDHDQFADRLLAGEGVTQPAALPLGIPVPVRELAGLPTHQARPDWSSPAPTC